MVEAVRLLLIAGSLRDGSVNDAVLRTAAETAPADVTATRYLSMASLPHFNPDDDHDPLPEPVVELRRAIADSDAVMFCTPEYAGALPGSFKNLLDWTVGGMETVDRPVAWINASTSPSGASGTHDSLRTVLTYTGCRIVDEACARIPVNRAATDAGRVVDLELRDQIAAAIARLRDHVTAQR